MSNPALLNRTTQNYGKKVVYQVFTRLFGNMVQTNTPWGTKQCNGVGKFADFNERALTEIKALGVTHIWYTGVLHHALVEDYTHIGISNDHPSIVKGRAGSPYAIKDYFQVNPDLADDPVNRMAEFEALIQRTHKAGLKVIIDIVPNHVARHYKGLNNPDNVTDFGIDDRLDEHGLLDENNDRFIFHRNNNFYYNSGQSFKAPDIPQQFLPLGGDYHLELRQPFIEYPAKWTGNGSRKSKPEFNDWYETVKINYGIRPDGSKDFAELPEKYSKKGYQTHVDFWKQQELPDTWKKFKQIALFWLDKGVDGFRYDVAELVPVEFWSYLNSTIKIHKPDTFLLAEVYQPEQYRNFINLGKMDFLYDKVGLYDTLKEIMQHKKSVTSIIEIQRNLADIEHHMLHFLENHDEQRIASPEFAGRAELARPAMLLCATISPSPTMIYFGQEVGEPAAENAGFGQPSRTSIFDYVGVPHHQRWMNHGKFDGSQLTESERQLRSFYQSVLNYSLQSKALLGDYIELYPSLQDQLTSMKDRLFLFARKHGEHITIIVVNFSENLHCKQPLVIPKIVVHQLSISCGVHYFDEKIEGKQSLRLDVNEGLGSTTLMIPPLAAYAFERRINLFHDD